MEFINLNEDNIDQVVNLYKQYYNTYEDGMWTDDTTFHRIHQVVTREDSYGLILKQHSAVVGFVMGYFEQYDDCKAYDLVEIVIGAEYHRQGYGSMLMKEIEERMKAFGAALIQLQSVNDLQHDHFYSKLGYQNCSNLVIKAKSIQETGFTIAG